MRTARLSILAGAMLGAGCLEGAVADGVDNQPPREWPLVVIGGGELVLDCDSGDAPDAHALFECDSVTIYSCDEMSDAVLEYESGRRERFAGLRGQSATLAARGRHDGQRIVSVRLPARGSDRHAVTAGERLIRAPDDSCGAPAAAAGAAAVPGPQP